MRVLIVFQKDRMIVRLNFCGIERVAFETARSTLVIGTT